MENTHTKQAKTICYYDGECPLCKIEINAMKKQDKIKAIQWVDITKNQQALEDAGITYQQAMDRIHIMNDQKQIVTGVRGFLTVWQQLPYYRKLVPLIRSPPILSLMEALYSLFARNRLILTGRSQENSSKEKIEEAAK